MTNFVLEAKSLIKNYQDADKTISVLKGIDFAVKPEESVAIVGRSGSGKTTLLNMLGGLEKPTAGEVFLNQIALKNLSDRKRGALRNRFLGLIFQFHHLLPEFTALENVCMPLLLQGTSVSKARLLSTAMLEKVGLKDRIDHKPATLSGGERQRVAIARALVTSPKCILADEPTGNLDNENAEEIYALMMGLIKSEGSSFIVVTHDLQLAKRMHRQVTLQNGLLYEAKPSLESSMALL